MAASSSSPSLFSQHADGDASSTSDSRHVLRVGELVSDLKETIAGAFSDLWVEGEISNFRTYRSGHSYFTLKDDDAQLRCVLFSGYAQYVFFEPQDGMLVRLRGDASVYEARGELQLIVRSMRLAGEGALQKAFDALKRRLESEGLFDPSHKKRLPSYPETVGVVTSGDGAALHDVLSVLGRRFPQVRVLVCPVRVQGMGACDEIADAVRAFNALEPGDAYRPDVLIVGRGGGSVEDLWSFNEEVVARAIYESEIPIVSAVGHETDFSIADYAADVRAATPSMAAELVVPDRRDVEALVRSLHDALRDRVLDGVREGRRSVRALTGSHAFHRPLERLRRYQQYLDELAGRQQRAIQHRLQHARVRAETARQRLELLDPNRPLQRGYVRVERDGKAVRRAADTRHGDALTLRFRDGDVTTVVQD